MTNLVLFEKGVQPTWPAFVRPKENELLSSWLIRNAHNHNLKVHTFCNIVWPMFQIWNRDIDRLAPEKLIKTLNIKANTPIDLVWETTLKSYEGKIFKSQNPYSKVKWIIPLGIYHRIRRFYGLMYCPNCLKKDDNMPYYRKHWRLSLSIVCPECGCYLFDCCPNCQAPIIFFRNDFGQKDDISRLRLSQCFNCYQDLTKTVSLSANEEILNIQKKLYKALYSGYYDTGCEVIYSHHYFDVLHQIISLLLSKSNRLDKFQKDLCESFSFKYEKPKGKYNHCFERTDIKNREKILIQANWLLEDWPERFIHFMKPYKIYSYWLLKNFSNSPLWYNRVVYENFYVTNINRRF